jgi:hypothetical protein
LAAPLLNQYNQNVSAQQGAAGQLFNAGGQTASGLSSLDQTALGNRAQGFDIGINGVPQAQNAGAMGVLDASSMARKLPLQNLGLLEALTVPIASLGGQSSGTATGTFTKSPWDMAMQAMGLFSGGDKSAAAGAGAFLSDRRAKDDIAQIGELYDGTPIYRFRYKGDPRVSVGLMADDVEKYAPHAVSELGGYKMVDYGLATARAVGAK